MVKDSRGHSPEPQFERTPWRLRVMIQSGRVQKAVKCIENESQRFFPATLGKGAAALPLLQTPVYESPNFGPMLSRGWSALFEGLDKKLEESRLVIEPVAIGTHERENHAFKFVTRGIGRIGNLTQPRFNRFKPL